MANNNFKGLTKKERKELLRTKRDQNGSASKFTANILKIAGVLIFLLVIAFFVYVLTRPTPAPKEIGEAIAIQGQEHIELGSSHPPYNSNPPTSGPHYAEQAKCQIYNEEVVDEAAIHSLEHGAVWISYKDKSNTDLAKKLTDLINQSPSKMLLSPRSKNDSNIALAAWGRLFKLSDFDEQQIKDFIDAYRNKGPEFAPC